MSEYILDVVECTEKEVELYNTIAELKKELSDKNQSIYSIYMDFQVDYAVKLIELRKLTIKEISDVTGLEIKVIKHLSE